jgi:hypothetical protein
VDTIEQQYGVDFGVRGDMHLGTLRQREGVDAIQALLRRARRG